MVGDDCFGGLPEGSQSTISLQIMVDRVGFEPATSAVQTQPLARQ